MKEIIKEIEQIILGLSLSLEEGKITKENLKDDIKILLEDNIVELIEKEIING